MARTAEARCLSPSGNSPFSSLWTNGGGLVDGRVALGLEADLAGLGQTIASDRGNPVEHLVAVVEDRVPLQRLAGTGLLDQLALEVDRLADPRLGGLDAVGHGLLGDLGRTGLVGGPGLLAAAAFHHHDGDLAAGGLAAGDDHVEGGLVTLGEGGIRPPGALGREREPDGTDRAVERDARKHERSRGGVDAEDVGRVLLIGAEDVHDDLGLVAEPVDEQRPQRPVDQPGVEDGDVGWTALPPEERSGDAAGGVHPLLDVDGEREEVDAFPHTLGRVGRGQDEGVADPGNDRALRLRGELAGLEGE